MPYYVNTSLGLYHTSTTMRAKDAAKDPEMSVVFGMVNDGKVGHQQTSGLKMPRDSHQKNIKGCSKFQQTDLNSTEQAPRRSITPP
jgi:hypothetical protein